MRIDDHLEEGCIQALFASDITRKRRLFDSPMNSGFFEGFQRRRLGVRQPRFGAALRKDPPSAACLHQQKLDSTLADAIADRRHLLQSSELTQMVQTKKFRGR